MCGPRFIKSWRHKITFSCINPCFMHNPQLFFHKIMCFVHWDQLSFIFSLLREENHFRFDAYNAGIRCGSDSEMYATRLNMKEERVLMKDLRKIRIEEVRTRSTEKFIVFYLISCFIWRLTWNVLMTISTVILFKHKDIKIHCMSF